MRQCVGDVVLGSWPGVSGLARTEVASMSSNPNEDKGSVLWFTGGSKHAGIGLE